MKVNDFERIRMNDGGEVRIWADGQIDIQIRSHMTVGFENAKKRQAARPEATAIALLDEALACMERHHHTTDLMRKIVCDKIRDELKRHKPQRERPKMPAECVGGCPPKQVCGYCQWFVGSDAALGGEVK